MRKCFILFLFLVSYNIFLFGQESSLPCFRKNNTFSVGEELTYIVSYNWFVVFSEVGQVNITIDEDKLFGHDVYHFAGVGKSYNWWDKFFKVRDRYETWVRQDNMRPLFFQRNNREGGYRQHEIYTYDGDSIIYRKDKVNEQPLKFDTIPIKPCTFDVMSALLYTRNLDYNNIKIGDKIPITVAMDRESYDLYYRYQGLENIKLKDFGTFECMKFTILLVEGTVFHEGEDMAIWVTNDKNRIPVYVESPILIGSVKVRLTEVKGNKFPITSLK